MEHGVLRKYPYLIQNSYDSEVVEGINFESTSLVWLSKNDCTCTINFKPQTILPNTLLFFNKGEVFSCENNKSTHIKVLSFNSEMYTAASTLVASVFNSLVQNGKADYTSITYSIERALILEHAFNAIDLCLNIIQKNSLEKLTNLLNTILIEGLNYKLNKDYNYLIQFVEILNNQHKINHNLSNYADQLDIAPKDLLRKFQKLGFEKPSVIIKRRVLLEAKRFLAHKSKTANEICFEIGFSDPAYFSRFFKKNTNMTTQEFRKQLLKNST